MTRDELDALWRDPAHWHGGGVYRAPADPRLIVPKSIPSHGWTVNMAHPRAKLFWATTFLCLGGVSFIIIALLDTLTPTQVLIGCGIVLGLVLLLAGYITYGTRRSGPGPGRHEALAALWRDPAHWKNWNTAYNCPDDPRIIVPPRVWWSGYVANWAHPCAAAGMLLFSIAIAIGPFFLLLATGALTLVSAAVTLTLSIIALTWMALYLSTNAG